MLDFRTLSQYLSEMISRAPIRSLILAAICTTVFALGLPYLSIAFDHQTYFDSDNPRIAEYNEIQESFTSTDNIMFMVSASSTEHLLSPETLGAIEWLTNKSWALPFADRVVSPTNAQVVSYPNGKIEINDMVVGAIDQSPAQLSDLATSISRDPAVLGKLLSHNGKSAVVNVTLSRSKPTNVVYPEANAAARKLLQTFRKNFPSLKIQSGGYVPLFNAFVDTTMANIAWLFPTLFVLTVLLLHFIFRHPAAIIGIIAALLFSLITTIGAVGWSGLPLNGITATSPIVILTVSMAGSIHLVSTYLRKLNLCRSKSLALSHALSTNLRAIVITATTTVVGFLSLNFTDAPPFRQLGNIAALGVASSAIFSLSVLPACLMLFGPNHCKKPRKLNAISTLADVVTTHPRNTLFITLFAAITISVFIPLNHYNDQFESYFHPSSSFRQSMEAINAEMGGSDTLEIAISHRDGSSITNPKFLEQVDSISSWLSILPNIQHVSSISQTLKRLNQQNYGNQSEYFRIPETALGIERLLNDYSKHVRPEYSLQYQLTQTYTQTRIQLITSPMDAIEAIRLDDRITRHINLNYPDLDSKTTSIALALSYVGAESSWNMISVAALALVTVSVLLALAFRSLKLGIISIIPNLLPGFLAFGVWGLLIGELSMGVSAALGIAMGIIVDDTVHFLNHYCAIRDKGGSTNRAVYSTMVRIGPTIITTTLILALGFLVLSQTTLRLNSDIGYFCSLVLVLALLFDLSVLPATLILLKNYESKHIASKRNGKIQHAIDRSNDDELIMIRDSNTFDLRTQNIKIYLQEICSHEHPENRCNVEVLSRIEDSQGKLLFPRTFLPQLEQLNLLNEYDRITILKLFDKLDEDITQFTRVELFNINVTEHSILDPAFPNFVAAAAKSRHLQPARLCFEFNGESTKHYLTETAAFTKKMRAAGFKLALCLEHGNEKLSAKVKQLAVDFIKIDARVVEQIEHDTVLAKTYSQLKQHASDMTALIIANNVDRKNLKHLARSAGIFIYQGYEIATPVDIHWASFVERPLKQEVVKAH